MGKIENQEFFEFENVSIVVKNGVVTKCFVKAKTATKSNRHFYETLNYAMEALAKTNPKTFIKMYKSLNFSVREYKMARKIYEEYRLKLYNA